MMPTKSRATRSRRPLGTWRSPPPRCGPGPAAPPTDARRPGRYFEPLIARPSSGDPRLSFSNLVEAHVLRSLRTKHEVPMSAVRVALDYAGSAFRIERLLLSDELRTAAGTLFIE